MSGLRSRSIRWLPGLLAVGAALWWWGAGIPSETPRSETRGQIVATRNADEGAETVESEVLERPERSEPRAVVSSSGGAGSGGAGGLEITVLVRTGDDIPVSGARVSLVELGCEPLLSDAMGQVQFEADVAHGEPLRVAVDAPGFTYRELDCKAQPRILVVVPKAALVRGRVVDKRTRQPIAHARVTLIENYCRGCRATEVRSSLDGAFLFPRAPSGSRVMFQATADGYLGAGIARTLGEPNVPCDVELGLESTQLLSAVVVDYVSRRPIVAARVTSTRAEGKESIAEADGTFNLPISIGSESNVSFSVSAPGYGPVYGLLDASSLALPDEIALVPSLAIRGVVVDSRGQPVTSAVVRAIIQGGMAGPSDAELPMGWRRGPENSVPVVQADTDGGYQLAGLCPWSTYEIQVIAEGYTHLREDLLTGAPGLDLERKLTLETHDTVVAGRVTLNGEPVAGYVNCWVEGGQGALLGTATCNTEGIYRIVGIPPGAAELGLVFEDSSLGHLGSDAGRHSIMIRVGEVVTHDFQLKKGFAPISGMVVAPVDEEILPEAWISATRDEGRVRFSCNLDQDGQFSMDVEDHVDTYDLVLWYAHETVSVPDVKAGTHGVEIFLPSMKELNLRVVDMQTLAPLDAFQVLVLKHGGSTPLVLDMSSLGVPDLAGTHRLLLSQGTYDLLIHAESSGYVRRAVSDCTVPGTVEVEMVLGVLTTFMLPEGMSEFPPDYRVAALSKDEWQGVTIFDRDSQWKWDGGLWFPGSTMRSRILRFSSGAASLRCLGPGTYELKSIPPGLEFSPSIIRIQGEEEHSVALTWR